MKKVIIENIMDFLQLLEDQKNGEIKFPTLDQVLINLCQSSKLFENDSIIPLGSGELVTLISHNPFPDPIPYVHQIGDFNITIVKLEHVNRVLLFRKNLLHTWTIAKN